MADLVRTAAPLAGLALVGACLLGLALGGAGWLSGSTEENRTEGTAAPLPPTPNPAAQADIPTLDATLPARTETATFALG